MSKHPNPKDYGITGAIDHNRRILNPQIDPETPPTQEELVKALDQLLFERVAKHRAIKYNNAVAEINHGESWR